MADVQQEIERIFELARTLQVGVTETQSGGYRNANFVLFVVARRFGLRYHQPSVAVGQNLSGANYCLLESVVAQGRCLEFLRIFCEK